MKQFLASNNKTQGTANIMRVAEELLKYRPGRIEGKLKGMYKQAGLQGRIPPVKYIPHHLAHAASTYYASGMEESHILVVDGSGENKCTTLYKGKGPEITMLKEYLMPDSLGWFYQSITEYLGFKPNNHEGKVMALAAYGEKDPEVYARLGKMLSFNEHGHYRYDPAYSFAGNHNNSSVYSDEMVDLLGPARTADAPLTAYHKNIAFAAQNMLETVAVNIVKEIAGFPDFNGNLCIAGGVGLNCRMNGTLAQVTGIRNLYVPPHCSDNGTALGAAMLLSAQMDKDPRFKMDHAYWGPGYDDNEIARELSNAGAIYTRDDDICKTTATLLADGKVIAWFQGRMEVGSRALGNRSILASPISPGMRDHINANIKGREVWRPFAASLLHEKKDLYLKNANDAPFMSISFDVTEAMTQHASSAIHTDQTTRPQTVRKEINEKYWQLIYNFGEITGVYALLNTSFNLCEEPIVCSPADALRSFYGSALDYLVMGNFIVKK